MTGRICLFRYRDGPASRDGFHLSADRQGAIQLLELLNKLHRTRSAQLTNVTLDPVTPAVLSVPNRGGTKVTAYRHWELFVDPRFPPERLHFIEGLDRVRTEMSPIQAESIAGGVEDIRERRGDYAIGDEDSHQLWFWWQDEG